MTSVNDATFQNDGHVNGNGAGWSSPRTLGLLAAAAALLALFVRLESRVASPLVPLGLFRHRNLVAANVVGVLWSAAMFAWFFLAALYLQEFVSKDTKWAHFDLFAWNNSARPGRPEGGEAMTVRAIYAYLKRRFA